MEKNLSFPKKNAFNYSVYLFVEVIRQEHFVINFNLFLPTEVTINLEVPDSEVVESDGTVSVRVTLSAPFPDDIDFVIRTLDDSANGNETILYITILYVVNCVI